jgi:hypothetical protein
MAKVQVLGTGCSKCGYRVISNCWMAMTFVECRLMECACSMASIHATRLAATCVFGMEDSLGGDSL